MSVVDRNYNSLNNYKVEKKIGRGQFSTVYRALYLPENRHVALKQVPVSYFVIFIAILNFYYCEQLFTYVIR